MKKCSKIISVFLAVMMILTSVSVVSFSAAKSKSKLSLANTGKGIELKWKKTSGAKKYVIARKLSSAKKYKVIKTVSAKSLKYVDKKVSAGKKYTYTVSANSFSTANAKDIVRLKAPTGVKVKTDAKKQAIVVSFNKVKGAKKYDIYKAEINGSKTGKFEYFDTTSKTKYNDYLFVSGQSYKYKVVAVNGKSESCMSASSKAETFIQACPIIARMNEDYNAINVYWMGEMSASENYRLYRSVGEDSKDYKLIANLTDKTADKGMPCEVEINPLFLSMIGAGMAGEDFSVDDINMAMFTDTDVVQGETYNYYVEVQETKSPKAFYRSEAFSIKCDDADKVMKVGETNDSIKLLDEYNDLLASEDSGFEMKATIVSDNENVVSVDKNGVITAVAPGVANIKEELEINMEMLPGIKQNVVKISATAKIKVVE